MSKKTKVGKIPKKQQVYNKFLFDSHLNTMRAVEKSEQQVSQHIKDHRTYSERFDKILAELMDGVKKQNEWKRSLTARLNTGADAFSTIQDLKRRYDMMESANCANLERLNKKMDDFSSELSQVAADINKALISQKQINDVARECTNKQAAELVQLRKAATLQGQHIVELEKALAEKKPHGRPKK